MRIRSLVVSLVLALCSVGALAQVAATDQSQTAPPPATVTGLGTTNYIPMWTGSSTLGNSKMFQTGGKIGVNTTSPTVQLDVNGRINTSKNFSISGTAVLTMPQGATGESITLGNGAGPNISGTGNTAIGAGALSALSSAVGNTAVGHNALFNDAGEENVAMGEIAMAENTTGSQNTGIGYEAVFSNTTGQFNVGLGTFALGDNTTGSNNIGIGYLSARHVAGGNSNNIHIGSQGVSTDNNTIRIGDIGTYTSFFVAGVSGVTTSLNDAVPVVVDTNGQLGTISSSRRFNEDIHDMGEASDGLMRLRPVTFRYQKAFADGSKPVQYGLIAEEVAEVYPDLVARGANGQVQTVKYQVLDSMLLNEVQKQQAEVRSQKDTIENQQAEINGLKDRLTRMEAALASMSAGK